MDLLKITSLKVYFDSMDGLVKAVDGVNLTITEGETLALLGETGSGKTVLGLAVMRLLPRTARWEGEILYRGKNLLSLSKAVMRSIRGREIAMIMQNPLSSLNPSLTVGEQIAETIREHRGVGGKEAWLAAELALEKTGIPAARARQYPHQLSGGMRQRAMIALGLACKPSLLIADEPTKGLDVTVQTQIIQLLKTLPGNQNAAGSILLITHDLGVAAVLANRIAVMYAGKIVELGGVKDIFNKPGHPYTRGLIAAHPGNGLQPIGGHSPSLLNPPPGCGFHPRCPVAKPLCRLETPPLAAITETRKVRCHYA